MTMPLQNPQQSWQQLRNYIEKWRWEDPKTGLMTTGYVVPEGAAHKSQVAYHIKYVTQQGVLEEGNCITLKAYPKRHQHMVKFTESGEVRIINDYLVIEVDGTQFVTH